MTLDRIKKLDTTIDTLIERIDKYGTSSSYTEEVITWSKAIQALVALRNSLLDEERNQPLPSRTLR